MDYIIRSKSKTNRDAKEEFLCTNEKFPEASGEHSSLMSNPLHATRYDSVHKAFLVKENAEKDKAFNDCVFDVAELKVTISPIEIKVGYKSVPRSSGVRA